MGCIEGDGTVLIAGVNCFGNLTVLNIGDFVFFVGFCDWDSDSEAGVGEWDGNCVVHEADVVGGDIFIIGQGEAAGVGWKNAKGVIWVVFVASGESYAAVGEDVFHVVFDV